MARAQLRPEAGARLAPLPRAVVSARGRWAARDLGGAISLSCYYSMVGKVFTSGPQTSPP